MHTSQNNVRISFSQIKKIFNTDNFVIIFSLPKCPPCNALFSILNNYDGNVVKINIENDLHEADYNKIYMVPFIVHVNQEQFKKWMDDDYFLDCINDEEKCVLYVDRTAKFLDSIGMSEEF
jgi:glutaredoxin